jgi:hypothetical protein
MQSLILKGQTDSKHPKKVSSPSLATIILNNLYDSPRDRMDSTVRETCHRLNPPVSHAPDLRSRTTQNVDHYPGQ